MFTKVREQVLSVSQLPAESLINQRARTEHSVESQSTARYESLPLANVNLLQVDAKKRINSEDDRLVYQNDKATSGHELFSTYQDIVETINNTTAGINCNTFEGASIARTHLVRAIFTTAGEREAINITNIQRNSTEFRQETNELAQIYHAVTDPSSETFALNRWLSGQQPEFAEDAKKLATVSTTDQFPFKNVKGVWLLVNYALQRYQWKDELKFIMSKAEMKLRKERDHLKSLSVGRTTTKDSEDPFFKEFFQNALIEERLKSTEMCLNLIEKDKRDSVALYNYLTTGCGSDNIELQFRRLAKDQLLNLDLWKERWQQRELSILLRYKFKDSESVLTKLFKEKKGVQSIPLYLKRFDEHTHTSFFEKIERLNQESKTGPNDEWYNLWWESVMDCYSFIQWSEANPNEAVPYLEQINKTDKLESKYLTTNDRQLPDLRTLKWWKHLKESRDSLWLSKRKPWEPLSSANNLNDHKLYFEKAVSCDLTLKILGIEFDKPSTSALPTKPKEFSQLKNIINETKVNEFIEGLLEQVLSSPKNASDSSLVYSTDVDLKTESNELQITEQQLKTLLKEPKAILSYCQVAIVDWLYKKLYNVTKDRRQNTACLKPNVFKHLTNVFSKGSTLPTSFATSESIYFDTTLVSQGAKSQKTVEQSASTLKNSIDIKTLFKKNKQNSDLNNVQSFSTTCRVSNLHQMTLTEEDDNKIVSKTIISTVVAEKVDDEKPSPLSTSNNIANANVNPPSSSTRLLPQTTTTEKDTIFVFPPAPVPMIMQSPQTLSPIVAQKKNEQEVVVVQNNSNFDMNSPFERGLYDL